MGRFRVRLLFYVLLLSIVFVLAMFSGEVFFEKVIGHTHTLRHQKEGVNCHPSDFFQDNGIFDGLFHRDAPSERPVVRRQDRRAFQWRPTPNGEN